jgi:hypothetical protein
VAWGGRTIVCHGFHEAWYGRRIQKEVKKCTLAFKEKKDFRMPAVIFALTSTALSLPTCATAASLGGQVLGGGAPIANSTVTLWATSAGAPKQLAQVLSGADGRFMLTAPTAHADSSLYLVAQGGQPTANKAAGNNPAIAMMTVLGSKTAGQGHDQRVHHHRLRMDPQPGRRRQGHQGFLAGPAHHRRQCTQLCRSRHRRLGHDHPGSAQQQPDADNG